MYSGWPMINQLRPAAERLTKSVVARSNGALRAGVRRALTPPPSNPTAGPTCGAVEPVPAEEGARQAAKGWRPPSQPPRRREGAAAPASPPPEAAIAAEKMEIEEQTLPQDGSGMENRGPQGQTVFFCYFFGFIFAWGCLGSI